MSASGAALRAFDFIVIGGGSGGIACARRAAAHGARVALFGRKINNAEHQLAFIEMLRFITEGKISPEEAVRAYHGVLQAKNIRPQRALADDLILTDQAMSYDGNARKRATVEVKNNPLATAPATPTAPAVTSGPAPSAAASAEVTWPLLPSARRYAKVWPSTARSTSWATSSAVGGSLLRCRSWMRTQPTSTEIDASMSSVP